VFLAWARMDAVGAGKKPVAARLRERARRLTAIDVPEKGTIRVVMTWPHPELRAELWSSALGAPMPAADGDPALGIAQTAVPVSQAESGVEIRLSPEDADRAARLGAEATLTAITDEGTDGEKIARLAVRFERIEGKPAQKRRFRIEGGTLTEAPLP
jgi:Ca-activated chloride channel family protein